MQVCRSCGAVKPLTEYPIQRGRNSHRGTGIPTHRKHCKACVAAKARDWRAANPGYKGSGKLTGVPPEHRRLMSLIRARVYDAKARAGQVAIDAEWAYRKLIQQNMRCAISGLLLTDEKHSPWIMSLDQIEPGLGYTEENTCWVAWAVNRAKGDLSMAEFVTMCSAIVEGATTIPQGSTLK